MGTAASQRQQSQQTKSEAEVGDFQNFHILIVKL